MRCLWPKIFFMLVNVENLKLDERRTIQIEDVSDWMILVGKKLFGGYTIRVLSERDPENTPKLKCLKLE